MNKSFFWAAVAALCLLASLSHASSTAGCGKAIPKGMKAGKTHELSMQEPHSSTRHYYVHLPATYDANTTYGLVFSFHAHGESAADQEELSQFSDPAVNPGMIAVYPSGVHNQWQGDPDASTDDVAFTLQMIDSLSAQFCIDSDQIYASGKSNGGGFAANILACDPVASTRIAAFAGISGAYYQNDSGTCNGATCAIACSPGRTPVPLITTHGTADPTIPYGGGARRGECLPSLPHFMTVWAQTNGLGAANVSTSMYNGSVTQFEFGSGNLQGINTEYEVFGLKHMWPSTVPNRDGCCAPFNASTLLMEFFNKWTLPSSNTLQRSASFRGRL